ncbi:Ribosomal RNA processing protein 36 [Phytophthora citrophthora]|uniref:rRNA biogenesis protein RRP36 n=1 Tax=Phytophthora citrophthora TaxID=4793 RepID=A0AAD9G5A6_9STRA|nr:Ribosomal RNA processing protein 36 [Phytophthora citrophthora]
MNDTRDVPLEERLRQKKQGFAVQKADEAYSGPARRANKNQPLELSSKRAVGRFRQVVDVKKRRILDPRFEAQSGRLNEDLFNKSYAFLDDYKQRELQELKQQLKKTKNVTKKDELKVSILRNILLDDVLECTDFGLYFVQHEIAQRQQELTEKKKQEKIKSALTKRKREEREAVASGKGAFYLKRKDKKKLELQAKFQDLQETGRLSKFMAKKRKKNASKDHRWLPTQRK